MQVLHDDHSEQLLSNISICHCKPGAHIYFDCCWVFVSFAVVDCKNDAHFYFFVSLFFFPFSFLKDINMISISIVEIRNGVAITILVSFGKT